MSKDTLGGWGLSLKRSAAATLTIGAALYAACGGDVVELEPSGSGGASATSTTASGTGGADVASSSGETSTVTTTSTTSTTSTTGTSGGGGTAGGGGEGGAGGSSSVTVEEACASYVKARCERLSTCTNGAQIALRFGDLATCEARLTINCLADLAAPETSSTPALLDVCASALGQQDCAGFFGGQILPECTNLPGGRADGDACFTSTQCASTFCLTSKDAVCGVCAPIPQVGDTCQANECGPSLFCATTVSKCVQLLPNGAACDAANPCVVGLSCLGATGQTMGTCVPAGQVVGAACDPQAQTAPACDRQLALRCNPATSTCQQMTYVNPGGACGVLPGGGFGACGSGGLCVSNLCVGPSADGGSCDITVGPPCVQPAKCVGNVPPTLGACLLGNAATCP